METSRWMGACAFVLGLCCACSGGSGASGVGMDVGGDAGGDTSGDVVEDVADAEPDVADTSDDVERVDVPPGCGPTWVRTDPATGTASEMFAWEASRLDATATSAGTDNRSVCSQPGVLPWTEVSQPEAAAACASIGARLCMGAEWDNGCYGPNRSTYPYGNTYDPNVCNVLESPDGCLTGTCQLVPTGQYGGCRSASGVWDMSGNASEWVADQRSFGEEVYEVRGGNYASADDATIRCRNAHFWREADYRDPMLGFRCCRELQ